MAGLFARRRRCGDAGCGRVPDLADATVAVLGTGGTGLAVASGLVAAGVGGLHLVDVDVVEESNLTRQVMFTEADIGRAKVDVAARRLPAFGAVRVSTARQR